MGKNIRINSMGKSGIIGLISSVTAECKILKKELKRDKHSNLNSPVFYSGMISGRKIVLAISGVGKTNAAHAATLLIEKYAPALIINFGIGGAYPSSGLKVGDIAVAEKEIYGDEGIIIKEGFSDMRLIGFPIFKIRNKKYFNAFPLDKSFTKKAVKSVKLSSNFKFGRFVTVSTCTGIIKRALELEKRHNAICENMEGAAIAHICAMHGIPMTEIRGISNIVENRDTKKWDIKLASKNCQKVLLNLLKTLGNDLK